MSNLKHLRELEISFVSSHRDGEKLRIAVSKPPSDLCKRWVVFVNGRSEYIEKYPNIMLDLGLDQETGFLTWDHRGQGQSGGKRSHIDDYSLYAEDMNQILSEIVKNQPFCIVAHSMGSLISLYTVGVYGLRPSHIVLSSPLLKLPPKPFSEGIANLISTSFTQMGLGELSTGSGRHRFQEKFSENRYTHSHKDWERIMDTAFRCGGATFGWVKATIRALKQVYGKSVMTKIKCPILILGSSEESIVDNRGLQIWGRRMRAYTPVQFRMIVGARHELFSEIPRLRSVAVRLIHEFAPQYFSQHTVEQKTSLKSA